MRIPARPSPPGPSPRRPRRLPFRLVALALVGVLAACGDEGGGGELGPGEEPFPELLSARLVSPAGPEGAVVLEASGERIRAVRAGDRLTRVVERSESGRLQVAVIRLFPGEIRFTVLGTVVDEAFPEIEVLQVADGDDALRESLEGYRVELSR